MRSTKQREALKSSLRSKREKFLRAFYKKRLNKCAALSSAKRIKQARSAKKTTPSGLRATPVLDTVCGLQIIGCAATVITENTKNTMNTVFLFGAAQKSSLRGLFADTHKTQPQYSQYSQIL